MQINRTRYQLRKLQSSMTLVKNLSKKEIFQELKPSLVKLFEDYLNSVYICNGSKKLINYKDRGRPRVYNLYKFLDITFDLLDNGFKHSYIKDKYEGNGGGSFFRYFKLLCESGIILKLFKLSTLTANKSQLTVIDSFTVKSIDGVEGTGKNYLDRGRRGTKVTLVANINKIITQILITPANVSEVACLKKLLDADGFNRSGTLLSDKGYYGRDMIDKCSQKGIKLLMEPKRIANKKTIKLKTFICKGCKSAGICSAPKQCSKNPTYLLQKAQTPPVKYTHRTNSHETKLLGKHRNKIEHINGEVRRFRGINLKMVRKIAHYTLLVTLGSLLNNIFHNGFY